MRSMSHAHEDLLKMLYDTVAKEDMETVLELVTDDIDFHVFGRGPVSGSYLGKMRSFASSVS
jgi:ketosteroid isomerase-like protein